MNSFIIQLSLRQQTLERYITSFRRMNANYHLFSLYSETDLIDNLPEDFTANNYIALASIKGLKLSRQLKETNFNSVEEFKNYKSTYETAFFYKDGQRFDQKYYKHLGLPLLNSNSKIVDLNEYLDTKFDKDVFIKPTSDLKGFVGGILKAGTTMGEFIDKTSRMPHWELEPTLIADVKKIHSEYRFFVVGDEVITGSRYMYKTQVIPSTEIPNSIWSAAHVYAKKYQPDRVFTMDLALLENGDIEIVEYNCFNGSGVYHAPLDELVKRLMEIDIVRS